MKTASKNTNVKKSKKVVSSKRANQASLKREFKETFNALNDNHQKVLLRRLQGGKRGSFENLAKELGVSESRVFQIEQAAWMQIEAMINVKRVSHEGLDLESLTDDKEMGGLSQRTVRALKKNNITTMKDLFSLKEDNLQRLRGVGKKSFKEIMTMANKVKHTQSGSKQPA